MDVFETQIVFYWVVFGFILMASEIVIPGMVVFFLGLGALIVAFALWMGWIEGWMQTMSLWFVVSIFLLLTLRSLFAKLAPGDTEVGSLDEDQDAQGKIVEVVKTVHPHNDEGRIFYRGTTWSARCPQTSLVPGNLAAIIKRENTTWIVSPVDDEDVTKVDPAKKAKFT